MNFIKQIALGGWLLFAVACAKSTPKSPETPDTSGFAKGADISWVTEMEASGIRFKDAAGNQKDCFELMKNLGMNSIRLRVWVNPTAGWCNTKDMVVKALRAKQLGLRIMLDFHYSDWWADPGQQNKPAAWKNLSEDDLATALYNHTKQVMDTLKLNGISPEWVQIGNETNDGMLWPTAKASTNMAFFARLITQGYNAVKGVSPSSKVMVHISNGYNNGMFRWMFDGLKQYNTPYDVIGMSLYPETNNWQQLNNECLANMNDMIVRYGKEIMIAEVGMDVNAPDNCKAFLTDIIQKTKTLPNGKGIGVFYWEPQSYNWVNYNKGAFDKNNAPTPALDAFK